MKALWIENKKLSYCQHLPTPVPASGEALVKVRLAGICGTDLELLRGYYDFQGIPGHEFVGEVVGFAAQDQPAEEWLGQRVVGEINLSCGECAACRSGLPTHCDRRQVLGIRGRSGAFAEELVLPLRNLHRIPACIPDEAAVFTEPLAAALEIQEQAPVKPGDDVLVVGAGRLGQLVAQVFALTGCQLYVLARHSGQRQLLEQRGISCIREDQVRERSMDMVVEATGSPGGFLLARRAVRPRGVIVLKSTYHDEIQVNLSSVVVDEVKLVGSRCGPFPPALRLLEAGLVDPRPMIRGEFALQEGILAFEQARKPGGLKVLIRMESGKTEASR